MTDNIVTSNSSQSPFDAIRRYRADGSEYWLGRELMALFAYSRWENFGASVSKNPSVIQKAIVSAKASETYTESQFRYLTNLITRSQGGSVEKEDCELSRYASYLTAMNGDVTKPEVAAAQAYFAIKTREAETKQVQSQPVLPSRELALETARSVSEIKDLLADTDPRLCQMLVDVAINDAMQTIKAIAPATDTTVWVGVAEIAESLHLPVTAQNRASLGKFVKAICGDLGKQESRICNGRMMPIWCYPMPNADVESAVREFFN